MYIFYFLNFISLKTKINSIKDANDLDAVLRYILKNYGETIDPNDAVRNLEIPLNHFLWCKRIIAERFARSLKFHETEEGPFIVAGEEFEAAKFLEDGGFTGEFTERNNEQSNQVNISVGSNYGQVVGTANQSRLDLRQDPNTNPIKKQNEQHIQKLINFSSKLTWVRKHVWEIISGVIVGLIVAYVAKLRGWI